jgi:hypothetical protein
MEIVPPNGVDDGYLHGRGNGLYVSIDGLIFERVLNILDAVGASKDRQPPLLSVTASWLSLA